MPSTVEAGAHAGSHSPSVSTMVLMLQSSILYHAGFFENVTPVNFNTIATPHAGVPSYPSLFSSVSSVLGPKLLSRTA